MVTGELCQRLHLLKLRSYMSNKSIGTWSRDDREGKGREGRDDVHEERIFKTRSIHNKEFREQFISDTNEENHLTDLESSLIGSKW